VRRTGTTRTRSTGNLDTMSNFALQAPIRALGGLQVERPTARLAAERERYAPWITAGT
jgi:hypothetical protein